ncbi:MAG: aldo/keto reductase [Pseudomonadota bacterium]
MFTTLSGKDVSRYSFGCMQFGSGADEGESRDMYNACREAGINFFDTAHGYTDGRSETYLGRLIASERDNIFVATKCANKSAASSVIRREIAESLARLDVDVIDLLYLHRWDDAVPLQDSLAALAGPATDGTVRHIGVSNFAAWQVMKAREMARDMGFDIVALQPMYNLVKRQVEVELLPMAQSEGVAVCPYSPLGGGLLTGKYQTGETGRLTTDPMYGARYAPDWMTQSAIGLVELAKEVGVAPATLAVSWVARHPGVFGPIVSARTASQLTASLEAISFELDDALYARLSELSPTPPPATDRIEEV